MSVQRRKFLASRWPNAALRRSSGPAVLALWVLVGCASTPPSQPGSVLDTWQKSRRAPTAATADPIETDLNSPGAVLTYYVIATVDGRPIDRGQFHELLLAGRGAELLDELIVLQLARAAAQDAGLTVSQSDVDREHQESLRGLLSNLPAADRQGFDERAAEALLDQILTGRGISRQEYRLGMERNAYLRKLAARRVALAEQQVRAEYDRSFGERVQVRHIQMPGGGELEEVRRQLAWGVDFAELARRFSANQLTAAGGGLLAPFSRHDQAIPALLREVAWALEVGEVSNPVRVDNWHHIIKLEKRLPAESVSYEQVRQELRQRVEQRMIGIEMQRLSAQLYGQARIEIADPQLRADYVKRHSQTDRSPK